MKTEKMSARLMQGNEAIAEGAIAAGVTFFAGYPITPSTEIAEQMAALLPKIGGTFLQMEDEIGAMGAILGASLAGAKVMDATSGPGFSLKQELIGYAACAEIPCVLVNVQRVGPSTGQPTAPAQGDVMQTRWGTHGDHPIIVLSPWSVREAFDMTVTAVNYAERFRSPVILLTDEIVGHLRENVTLPAPEELSIYPRRLPKTTRAEGYQPYAVGEDLVPDVARFGDGFRIHVTGLLHDETGFPSGSPLVTEQLLRRLHEKIDRVGAEIIHTEEAFMEDADCAVVSYGGTARTAYEAVRTARADGIRVGFLRLQTIWPFADAAIGRLAARVQRILVAELNYGQLTHEITRAAHGTPVRPCLKYNMLDFTPQEIAADIRRMNEEAGV
nr:2-oxoacid:acceptor oxidoreductase subunit alpha [uncultured Selenomonas sp.]